MHSKWKIWDYVKNHPEAFQASEHGVYAFYSFDPLIASLLRSRFPKYHFHQEKLPVFQAKEVSLQWLEDNFLTMGLFGNLDSYSVTSAEQLSPEVKDFLTRKDLLLENRYLFLFFNKMDDFFKVLAQIDSVQAIEIQAPAFWESDKLLDFLADELKVHLSFEAKSTILNDIENSSLDFYNFLTRLSLNYGSAPISKDMLEELLEKNRLDNFEMAKLFGFKKMKEFYKTLLDIDPDYDGLRGLFYFLQTHMIKISDTSFIQEKNRQTKYDNQIISQAKLWKSHELEQVLHYLKNFEVKAKKKNPFLKEEIRSAYLRSLL